MTGLFSLGGTFLIMAAGFALLFQKAKFARRLFGLAILIIALPFFLPEGAPQQNDEPTSSAESFCAINGTTVTWRLPLATVISFGFFDPAYRESEGRQHLGIDLPGEQGTLVLAPFDGEVVSNSTEAVDVMQAALVIRDDQTGAEHVLGHIRSDMRPGSRTRRGEPIGEIREWGGNSHLHWGLNLRSVSLAQVPSSTGLWGWGRAPSNATKHEAAERGWVDPAELIDAGCVPTD